MGITYFILFVCIVFFSMMALAIAIIMSSYKTVKMELETERGEQSNSRPRYATFAPSAYSLTALLCS